MPKKASDDYFKVKGQNTPKDYVFEIIKVWLSATQHRKYNNGQQFQLSAQVLAGSKPKSKGPHYEVGIEVTPKVFKAIRGKKGVRVEANSKEDIDSILQEAAAEAGIDDYDDIDAIIDAANESFHGGSVRMFDRRRAFEGNGIYKRATKSAGWTGGSFAPISGAGSKKKSSFMKALGTAVDFSNKSGLTQYAFDSALERSNLNDKQKGVASRIGGVASTMAANKLQGRGFKSTFKKVKKSINSASKAVKNVAYDINLGKNIEAVKNAIPEEMVSTVIEASLVAGGTPADQAKAMAAASTGTLYGYDFSEKPSASNITGAVMEGAVDGFTAYATQGSGARLPSMQGRNIHAMNYSKEPRMMNGGSFRPIDGGSFRPIDGGSFRPVSGGAAKRAGCMVKGSQEARDHMAYLRSLRNK